MPFFNKNKMTRNQIVNTIRWAREKFSGATSHKVEISESDYANYCENNFLKEKFSFTRGHNEKFFVEIIKDKSNTTNQPWVSDIMTAIQHRVNTIQRREYSILIDQIEKNIFEDDKSKSIYPEYHSSQFMQEVDKDFYDRCQFFKDRLKQDGIYLGFTEDEECLLTVPNVREAAEWVKNIFGGPRREPSRTYSHVNDSSSDDEELSVGAAEYAADSGNSEALGENNSDSDSDNAINITQPSTASVSSDDDSENPEESDGEVLSEDEEGYPEYHEYLGKKR